MSQLTIVYDESEPPLWMIPPDDPGLRVRVATLPVANGLEGKDIYEIARKLAELMLEAIDASRST